MKKKIFSTLLALVLVLSFSLVAAPVAAAGMTNVSLRAGGQGAAEWSTDELLSGTYSAKLSVTSAWGDDVGLVNIFFEAIRLEDLLADPTFFANGLVDDNRGPYLNLLLENPASPHPYDPTGTYNDALEGEVATPTDNYDAGWHLMVGAGYYNASNSLGQGTVNHDLAYWQTEVPNILVVGVQIQKGQMGPQAAPAQTVYIDGVNFDGTLYDLEPATGAVTMNASSLLPAPRIGITVDPTTADFGQLDPGVASAPVTIALQNIGNVAEDFTASILNESHPPVYQDGLEIGTLPTPSLVLVDDWLELNVPEGVFVPLGLVLTVPIGTVPGTYTATLVFWAEAAA